MTRNESIRRCLLNGDATSTEIAAILQISPRSARVGLWLLQTQLHVTQTGLLVPSERGQSLKLYTLTRFGRLFMKKRARSSSGSDKSRPQESAVCARRIEG
jgi:predicted ArsR family transcriptional regulator